MKCVAFKNWNVVCVLLLIERVLLRITNHCIFTLFYLNILTDEALAGRGVPPPPVAEAHRSRLKDNLVKLTLSDTHSYRLTSVCLYATIFPKISDL